MRRMTERTFRVLGVQQIAVGGLDKAALRRFWVDLLGLAPKGSYRSEHHNVDEDILEVGAGVAAIEVDLMQPLDPERRPRVHEPALNHVGLWVDDVHAAAKWLQEAGVRLAGEIGVGAAGHEVCFLHPKSAEGVLVELVQAPPEVVAAFETLARA
jgi:lactoylglutathione lyase